MWIVVAAMVFWLGYVMYRICLYCNKWENNSRALVHLTLGNQEEIAEWLLMSICFIDGIALGRFDLAVRVEDNVDDTLRIAEIMSEKYNFILIDLEQSLNKNKWKNVFCFDLKELNTKTSLNTSLEYLRAL